VNPQSTEPGQPRLRIRVLEAAGSPAAAFAAALLGDFGAEVVVLEPPGGSAVRHLGSQVVRDIWWPIIGRNKSSLAIDPAAPGAPALLDTLVEHADILLVDDSGIGRALRGAAARTKHGAQVTRFFAPGSDRPDAWPGSTRAEFAACASGIVALSGWTDGPPVQPEMPLADATSGFMAALLALAELRAARLAKTPPQAVDLALHETLQRMNEWQLPVASAEGRAQTRNGNRFPMNWTIANVYRTRDRRMVTVSAATPAVAERLMRLVGGDALASDPRFGTTADRRTNMDALDAIIGAWMEQQDADDVLKWAEEAGVVIGPILDAGDLLVHPHVAARENIVRIDDRRGATLPMPAPLPRIDTLPGSVRHIGAPPGTGSRELLRALGIDAGNAQALRRSGVLWALEGMQDLASPATATAPASSPTSSASAAPGARSANPARRPFEGLRVLEAGVVLAGPFATSLLAELGAEVIKVEPPVTGDPMRQMGVKVNDVSVWFGVSARAKRCVTLDLKSERDNEIFLSLVEQADVLVENYRPGVLDRLGLGDDTLRSRNPRLVKLGIAGFGRTGPLSHRPGFGRIAEGMSGMVALSGRPDEVAMNLGVSVADTSAGLMGALGIAMSLFRRDVQGGPGATIDVALYEPLFRMTECQLALCERLGRPPLREGTNDPYGWGASGNEVALLAMECSDGHWLLADVRGLDAAVVAERSSQVRGMKIARALAWLREKGIEAAQAHDGATLAATPYFVERGDVLTVTDPVVGTLKVPGEIPKRSHASRQPLFNAAGVAPPGQRPAFKDS
jgi:crotonobetainyl-CoA:carnitine CoA-transferase CaiB-like acyl-CoA transferase